MSLPQATCTGPSASAASSFFSCRSAHCRTSSGVRSVVFSTATNRILGSKKLSGTLQSVSYTARYGIFLRFTGRKVAQIES